MPRSARLVIVANRLPVHRVEAGGRQTWQMSPGGLVGALGPLVSARRGAWVGWAGHAGRAPKPFSNEGIRLTPVTISSDELDAFYFGFSNRTIWPLYHDAVRTPEFRRRWWWPYREVNKRFAEVTSQECTGGDIVWVHDYQMQLVPGFIRELRPRARIGYFHHIPFPPEELFARLPWRTQLLEGLLGADLVGFQTKLGAQNFARAARQFTEARGTDKHLHFRGREVRVGAFPISIDVEKYESAAGSDAVEQETADLRARLGADRSVLLGVDRLDYTKGIDIRLRAFESLLSRGRTSAADCVMVQVAVPSREDVSEYAQLREGVEQIVGRINGEFSEPGRVAVHYLYRNLPFEQLVAYYRLADVMLVTPLRDGMNLVAKEFVTCQADDPGVLVLSEFAGAAHELTQSVLVNPNDIDGLTSAMEAAMQMPIGERRRRMAQLKRAVRRNDVHEWADTFLEALLA